MTGHRIKLPDGSSWPRPAMETDETYGPAWTARYAPHAIDREDLLYLAAVADAYGHLVSTPSAARALPQLRRALRADATQSGDPL